MTFAELNRSKVGLSLGGIDAFFFLIFSVVIVFTQLDAATTVAEGRWYDQNVGAGWNRYLKDGLLAAYYAVVLLSIDVRKILVVLPPFLAFVVYNVLCALFAASDQRDGLLFQLAACRYLFYLPVLLAHLARLVDVSAARRTVAIACAIFLVSESLIGLYQLFTLPPVYGSTFWGPKVIGTFENPNFYGQMLSLYLFVYFTITRKLNWIVLLTFVGLLSSGSRLAIISILFLLMGAAISLFRVRGKLLLASISLGLIGAVYALASLLSAKEVSGRDFSDPYIRYTFWANGLSKFEGASDWLFGVSPGMFSNSSITLFRSSLGPNEYVITDSAIVFVLGAFGLAGLMFISLLVWGAFVKGRSGIRSPPDMLLYPFGVYVLIVFGVTNVWESLYLLWPISILLNLLVADQSAYKSSQTIKMGMK